MSVSLVFCIVTYTTYMGWAEKLDQVISSWLLYLMV